MPQAGRLQAAPTSAHEFPVVRRAAISAPGTASGSVGAPPRKGQVSRESDPPARGRRFTCAPGAQRFIGWR